MPMAKTIAILAPSAVPFQIGGSEKFWWGLREALSRWSDAFVELLKLPSPEQNFTEIIASYKMFSRLELDHFDMLITTKYPAWMVNHPNHVCYLQHTLRGLYDTYPASLPAKLVNIPAQLVSLVTLARKQAPTSDDLEPFFDMVSHALAIKSLPSSLFAFPGPLLRELVHFLDKIALAPGRIKAYLSISRTVASRPGYLPANAACKILPHPSDLEHYDCQEGKYFFTASRLNSSKRISLLIDAMAAMPLEIPLKIAGTGPEIEFLKTRAGDDRRIQFLGHISDQELTALYAGAIAVPFVPFQEDYGLITIEAMKSGKPVITVSDSGGVCEFVKDGINGLVTEPSAPALARALTRLGEDRDLAAKMGKSARKSVAHINWQDNIRELLAATYSSQVKVLVAAPFCANKHGAGGPRRLFNFCAELAKEYNVCLICLGTKTQNNERYRELLPNFQEISLPWSEAMLGEASKLSGQTGQSSDDIAIMRTAADHTQLLTALQKAGSTAKCVCLSHPWLYPAVTAALPEKPLLYDAHNVEADLRKMIQPEMAAAVAKLESDLCTKASHIFACSQADATRLQNLYSQPETKISLAPHGCDLPPDLPDKATLRQKLPYSRAKLALFVASAHKPNLDAALAIADFARQTPDVDYLLAGSVSTDASIRNTQMPPNVHLLGLISEKTKNFLLRACDLGLNPVCSGSGVNLKSLEYLAFGLPCISTSTGMRGLPSNLIPAATICPLEDFPTAISDFFSNPPEKSQIERICADFQAKSNWATSLASLRPIISRLPS